MEKLALEVFDRDGGGSKFAFLPSDTSITITDTSEIFDSGDVWTYSFKLNIYDNAHIFGTAGEMHGSRLHEQVNKRRARLWVLGLPLYYGYLRLDDEVEVEDDGTVDISFESGQKTFQDMIEGAKANQVPLKDEVWIGMALEQKRTVKRKNCVLDIWSSRLHNSEYWEGYYSVRVTGNIMRGKENMAQQFPKYVRPFGNYTRVSNGVGESVPAGAINKDHPYDATHFYCNTSICYVLRQLNTEGEVEAVRDYRISYPKRINPAPNFFVLYWLDCLMKHLDIHVSENQMLGVEDLRRLFFANAKCGVTTNDDVAYTANEPLPFGDVGGKSFISSEDYNKRELSINFLNMEAPDDVKATLYYDGEQFDDDNPVWHKAYATSENFPDVEIKDVIEAVENGFGVRMLFNRDYTRVRVVLLRDVLRSQEMNDIPCEVKEVTKQENCIRGFRLTYGAGEEDTNYFYRGFANKLTHQTERWPDTSDTHDYSHWNTNLHYGRIKLEVSTLNKTCYIDMSTGNAYIVKIDEDFKDAGDEAYPALFECAGFMDAEDGDCTGEEETIKEIRVGFSPTIMNITSSGGYALFLNEDMGLPGLNLNDVEPSNHPGAVEVSQAGYETFGKECVIPKYDAGRRAGLFGVATETWVDFVDLQDNPVIEIELSETETWRFTVSGTVKEGYILYLADNYDINDEMTAPIETHDFGLTLGIMRGSGSDAYIDSSYDNIENEGNNTWNVVPGSGAYAHADTCDDYGTEWDYNGTQPGTSSAGYTGYEYGDKLLASYGCQNQCDLKTRKGENPNDSSVQETLSTYSRLYEGILILTDQGYYAITGSVTDAAGVRHTVWLSCVYGGSLMLANVIIQYFDYLGSDSGGSGPADVDEILQRDRIGNGTMSNMIIAVDPKYSTEILRTACRFYLYGNQIVHPYKDDQISLKLRAEKPNPYYDPSSTDPNKKNKYLEITNPALRHRGLADQLYKEYSYWVRNARIAKMTVRMELAQLVSIDKTVRQRIGDITGFVKKMQYSINMQSGLSDVTLEMWYL